MLINLAAAIALLFLGREVFVPVALAFVFATLLRPVVGRLEQWHIPAPAGAAMVISTGLIALWGIGFVLTPAVQGLAEQLPTVAATASTKFRSLPRPLDRVGAGIATAITKIAAPVTGDSGRRPSDSTRRTADTSASRAPSPKPAPAKAATPAAGSGSDGSSSVSGALPVIRLVFGTAASFVSTMVEIILLLAFFLAAGTDVRDRLMKKARESPAARALLDVGDEVGGVISRYLSLLALINLVQGTVITIAMSLIGMPVPLVWGAMAFVAEFFPYLGGATMVALLTLVGLAGSSGGPSLLLAPVIYILVTTVQNSLVSPVTYGRVLKLNPAAILVSVMIWWLVWGVIGAFLAVPILATIKIVCDRQKGDWSALGALIEG